MTLKKIFLRRTKKQERKYARYIYRIKNKVINFKENNIYFFLRLFLYPSIFYINTYRNCQKPDGMTSHMQ